VNRAQTDDELRDIRCIRAHGRPNQPQPVSG
jgi:hypothetical protein